MFAARTLDFAVKFRFVFRYEDVVFRRYVLALLSVGLLRKFEAFLVYPSLIWNKNPRPFTFFQKFRHFTYMLLWFHLVIPSFPARIDDMRSRFSALFMWHKKKHLSDFLKASVSQIDLIRFSRTFHRVFDLYEHAFLIISVLGLSNVKVIFLLKSYLLSYFTKRQLMGRRHPGP